VRSIRRAALALLALGVAAVAVAALRLDAGAVRAALGAALERQLGLPVELGPAELRLFPLPAVAIREARIGGARGPSLEARELRVDVSLPGLLAGEVVLRALELEEPRLRLTAERAASVAPDPARWSGAAPVRFALTKLVVRDGALATDELAFTRVELRGRLGLGPSARAGFSAELPGIGRLEAGELEVPALAGPPAEWAWSARAKLEGLELAVLGRALGVAELGGGAAGDVLVSGRGAAQERVKLALSTHDLALGGALVRASGAAVFTAEIPGRVELDLAGARIALAGALEKPPGVPLHVSAEVAEARGGRFQGLRIASPALEGEGQLSFAGGPQLGLTSAALDFAALAAWSPPAWLPKSGRVVFDRVRIGGDPLALEAHGALADVAVPVGPKLTLRVSGPIAANDSELRGDELSVALAGESVAVSALYDWHARSLALSARADGARIGPIAEAGWGRKDVSGRLYGRVELAGPPDPFALTGEGELSVLDGELPGVSIARTVGNPRSFNEPPGLDRFEKLGARFVVAGAEVKVLELTLVQELATATVSGDLALRDLRADFTGAVRMEFPELGAPRVRPILRMEGPLGALETHISMADNEDIRAVEAATIEAIRRAEREQRERKARKDG